MMLALVSVTLTTRPMNTCWKVYGFISVNKLALYHTGTPYIEYFTVSPSSTAPSITTLLPVAQILILIHLQVLIPVEY